MAAATINRDGPRGHVRAIQLAGAVSMLIGVTSSWAQGPYDVQALPFCPVYPPGAAPAIGPSNCTPVPAALWGPQAWQAEKSAVPRQVAPQKSASTPLAQGERPGAATLGPRPLNEARTVGPPGLQTAITLRTPGPITLEEIAALLGPISKRTVTFALSTADDYKKTDLTHRVRLTWTGPLQGLVDQLAAIYGVDVAVDDTAIRFSSRQHERAGGASTRPTS